VRACGAVLANSRFWAKKVKSFFPGSHAPPEFHRHRYPGMALEELRRRIQRFKEILGDETPITAEPITPQIFRIARTPELPQPEIASTIISTRPGGADRAGGNS